MSFKTTYILFGLLVAFLGVMALTLYWGPTAPAGEKHLFPSMHARDNPVSSEEINKVVIERKSPSDADLVFERGEDKNWKIVSPRSYPADSRVINNLVEQIHSARLDEENKPKSLEAVGLKTPSRILKLSGKDREWTLSIGETTPGEENAYTYVTTSDRKGQPLAVKKRDLEAALENLNYFRAKELLGDNTADVRALKVTLGKKPAVELVKEKDRWKMTQPPYGYVDLSDLLFKLSEVRVDHKNEKENDFVEDGVKDLAKFHLDPAKAEVLRLSVTRGEGKDAKTTTAVIGISKKIDDDKKYYAALEEGPTRDVVKVTVDSVKPFVELVDDPGKYRNKNLVQLDSFRQPDAMDVQNTYGTLEFRRPDSTKPWELYRDKTSNIVDENEVRRLIDELNRKDLVTSFVDPKRRKELGLEKPDVIVKVWADSLEKVDAKKPEKPSFKKDVKPVTELRFGNRERDQVAVERIWGDETTIVLVPQTLLDQVRKGPLAYLDRSIPAFNTSLASDEDVTKIELIRSGETYEIERASTKDPWKFSKPAALKGREANGIVLRQLLDELNRLRAEEIVAEKSQEKDLANTYDLAKPPVKVVVTLTKDKKPTTFTFDLGKEVAGKGVYLKRSDRDMVYLVNADLLNTLKRELRDTTVFRFEPEKVTTLTLRGWKNVLGAVYTLSLEQKDGSWTVKSPSGFVLDPTKASDLVRELSRLQADKFVSSGKGLKLDEGALEVEIGLPDKKMTLTVGSDEGVFYFASSDQLKGDVFLIPKGSFEDIKKVPAYFAKK